MIRLHNQNCMKAMKEAPDDFWDLAIVDPPYGIHKKLLTTSTKRNRSNKFALLYMEKNWDRERPTKKYFDELIRVSKNQIVWGGNYFADKLPISRGWIIWHKKGEKMTVINNELAWTSFDRAIKTFERGYFLDNGFMVRENVNVRIHPTQKPIQLYEWLLSKYAKKGFSILDTHLGSGSSAIAAHRMGFEFDGYEIDRDYFEGAENRLREEQKQLLLFGSR